MASLIPPQFVVKLEANKGIDNDDDSGLACVQYFIIERWRNQKKPNTEFHDIRKVNISQKMTKKHTVLWVDNWQVNSEAFCGVCYDVEKLANPNWMALTTLNCVDKKKYNARTISLIITTLLFINSIMTTPESEEEKKYRRYWCQHPWDWSNSNIWICHWHLIFGFPYFFVLTSELEQRSSILRSWNANATVAILVGLKNEQYLSLSHWYSGPVLKNTICQIRNGVQPWYLKRFLALILG